MFRFGNQDYIIIRGGNNLVPILKKVGVKDDVIDATKPPKKDKYFTRVKNNTFPKQDYNFMADLLELPKTEEGFKYLFVVVDLWSDEFDIEPLKNKQPKTVLDAFKKMLKRKHLNFPKGSIATDQGSEFKGVFHDYIFNRGIYHKWADPGRKTQMSSVESLNRLLGYILNSYMNQKEIDTGVEYKEWTDIVDVVRTELNKMRKKKDGDPYALRYFKPITKEPKFRVGEVVHWALSSPSGMTDRKLYGSNFRMGDRRFSQSSVRVLKVLYYDNKKVPYRYLLNNGKSVSYTENQLRKAKDQVEQYFIENLIGKRKHNGRIEYRVKWREFPRDQSTWEKRTDLIKDGLQKFIDRYEAENK